jgi:hypothetical protein
MAQSLKAAGLLCLLLAEAGLKAGPPETWVPARWDGGPLEVARRAGDKGLTAAARDALASWYEPATLALLDGSPVNCLLLTLAGGATPEIEERQRVLVTAYAGAARARGLAVLGVVYPGADAAAVATVAGEARLDGLVLEGEFPGGLEFAARLAGGLRAAKNSALVIPLSPAAALRKGAWPVVAVEGVAPAVGKAGDGATASATGGLWIDSNLWAVRSFRRGPSAPPVWINHRPDGKSPVPNARSVADAAAAGGRWMVALDDGLRAGLFRKEPSSLAQWHEIGAAIAFYEGHPEWRGLAPFGNVGIVIDPAGPKLADSEEYLNLIARKQIPWRAIYRAELSRQSLAGLRALVAFDLNPATAAERELISAFAGAGGHIFAGPSWGGAPKDQTYTVAAIGEGEVAVHKDEFPDPEVVARNLNDLVPTPELGVSLFGAPSVLSYVSAADNGKRMLIQLVNYADKPAPPVTVWVEAAYNSARLLVPGAAPAQLTVKHSGSRVEIVVPGLPVHAALLLE